MQAEIGEIRTAQNGATNHRTQKAEQLVALRSLLTPGRVARGHVANLVSQHCGKFRLVVHQVDQLARCINIAAGNGESVVNAGIQQCHIEGIGTCSQAGLHCDVRSHLLHILGIGTSHLAAEFRHELIVILRAKLRLFGRNRRAGCDIGTGNAGTGAQRKRASARQGHGSKFTEFLERHSGILRDCFNANRCLHSLTRKTAMRPGCSRSLALEPL